VSATVASEAPDLELAVASIRAADDAVVPTLCVDLVVDAGEREVRSLGLNVQLRVDATRRRYEDDDEPRLLELFGPRSRWGQTIRVIPWTTTSLTVPAFRGTAEVELRVAATYDFEVLAAKYLNALSGGSVPVELLFSGTVFYMSAGRLQAAPLPWDREARAELPVGVWREALDLAFPGCAWLRLGRESYDRLWEHRAAKALPSWEATIDDLLEGSA
jgi:hypothetical protein